MHGWVGERMVRVRLVGWAGLLSAGGSAWGAGHVWSRKQPSARDKRQCATACPALCAVFALQSRTCWARCRSCSRRAAVLMCASSAWASTMQRACCTRQDPGGGRSCSQPPCPICTTVPQCTVGTCLTCRAAPILGRPRSLLLPSPLVLKACCMGVPESSAWVKQNTQCQPQSAKWHFTSVRPRPPMRRACDCWRSVQMRTVPQFHASSSPSEPGRDGPQPGD